MDGAQVAVANYRPDWWPTATDCLIRRVRLTPEQVSADPVHGGAGPCTPTSVPCRSPNSPKQTPSTPIRSS
jgi:hypothetical protein